MDALSTEAPARRTALTDAAVELFAARGYHATSVSELSRAIGLGRGALYYHINSKEDLLWVCLRIYADRLSAIADDVAALAAPAPARLRALSRAFLATVTEYRPYIVVSYREAGSLAEARVAELGRRKRLFEDAIEALLTAGSREGSLTVPHPRLTVLGFLGMHVWTFDWFNPRGPMTTDEVSDGLMDGLLHGLERANNK